LYRERVLRVHPSGGLPFKIRPSHYVATFIRENATFLSIRLSIWWCVYLAFETVCEQRGGVGYDTSAMTTPVPVLFLEPVGDIGGAQHVTLSLLKHLDRERFNPRVACLGQGRMADEVRRLGLFCSEFRTHRFRELTCSLSAVNWVRKSILEHGVRILHVGGTKTLAYGSPAGRLTGASILWHLFDPPPDPPSWIDCIARALPRDRVIASGTVTRQSWEHLLGVPVELFELGIELHSEHSRPPAPSEFAGQGPHVVMISRLQRFKGHTVLLDAMPAILDQFPDLQVHLIGGSLFGLETEYREEIEARLSTPPLKGRVHLPGFVSTEKLAALTAHCDLLVHPALVEPFGLVVAEAMAWSRPVVAASATGPARIVENGQTGFLVPPGDSKGLALGIIKILSDPDRAREMGEAGRRRVEILFDSRKMARRLEEIYAEMLG